MCRAAPRPSLWRFRAVLVARKAFSRNNNLAVVSFQDSDELTMDSTRTTLCSQRHWRAQCPRKLRRDGVGLQVLRVSGLDANGRAFKGVLDDLRVCRCPTLDLPTTRQRSETRRDRERQSQRERE